MASFPSPEDSGLELTWVPREAARHAAMWCHQHERQCPTSNDKGIVVSRLAVAVTISSFKQGMPPSWAVRGFHDDGELETEIMNAQASSGSNYTDVTFARCLCQKGTNLKHKDGLSGRVTSFLESLEGTYRQASIPLRLGT